jgi:hypothetical protein
MLKILEYIKGHSHAILSTLLVVQNAGVLKGTVGVVFSAVVYGLASIMKTQS